MERRPGLGRGAEELEEAPPRPLGGAEAGQVLGLHLAVDELDAPAAELLAPAVTNATFEASRRGANMLSPKKPAPSDTP